MVSFMEQVRILMWKNWTHRKRNKKRLLIEILWPLTLFLILMWVRTRGLKYREKSCHVIEKALPSVGGFEFFQNFICTLNNTCYDEYVENTDASRWDDALLVKFIRETTPIIKDLLGNDASRATITRLWSDVMDYVKLISSFQNTDNLRKLGSIKLGDLIDPGRLHNFTTAVKSSTGISRQEVEEFLNITLNLDKFDEKTARSMLDDFQNQKCDLNATYELVSFPKEDTFERLCNLDRSKAFTLLFLYNTYLDRDSLLAQLNGPVDAGIKTETNDPLNNKLPYDFTTLGSLNKLGRKVLEIASFFQGYANMTGSEMASVFIYEGVCGVKPGGNQSIFGIDPGRANRYDSLRDRLKDWNPDHHYENDPEISPACNTVFQRLESMPISSFMWRQIKPIIRGYIFYAPDNDATRLIMGKVEEKFLELQETELTINSVLQLLHRIRLWIRENVDDLNNIKIFLSKRSNIENIVRALGVQLTDDVVERIYSGAESLDSTDIHNTLERLDYASELLSELIGCVRYNKTKAFPTEWEAVDAGYKLLSAEKLWAVIVFYSNTDDMNATNATIPSHMYYKIRMDSDKVDGTRAIKDRLTSKGPRRRPLFDLKYITYGFVYLQEMIERSIIEAVTGEDLSQEQVYLQQYPYPCYIVDQFIRAISRTFPLFMVLSWVYASAMIVKSVVLEKERRLREVMKIMGVSNGAVWFSWFIESFVIMLISSTVLTIILKYGKVIEFSDPILIWIFLVSYTVATICFSFLVSTFFSQANSAAAAGGVIFFISYLPYNMMLIWEENLRWFETLSGCLISNVAFGFGCTYLARYEQDGIGAHWDTLSWHTLPDDDFNLSYCIMMLWVDSVLYLVLTWYIEAVFPGEFGVPRPWDFFLKSSYWFSSRNSKLPNENNAAHPKYMRHDDAGDRIFEAHQAIEKEPEELKRGVEIFDLCKTYPNGKTALHGLSINFYEDQITSFLGHNGAGKSTTISILTGLFPPSKGTALINGLDIRTDIDRIRTNLGICPQYNVLFDWLTVHEHLQFYAMLKGKKGKAVEKEFDEMLRDLGIPHKRKSYPNALSGGMKRKLSVAIAFVGGSKTVLLDEPTSGVDPYSRRSIWELLLKYKAGRTVILTTHFMDEADILGDRIAIISQGQLKALGSSIFLKSHFGQGYTLHIVKNDSFPSDSPDSNNESSRVDHDKSIEKFVRDIVPDAIVSENVGSEVALLLPYGTVEKFSQLFVQLNENLDYLGISSYGISDTSLEDVFLKITVDDLVTNVESFQALSSSCKRKVMAIFTSCLSSRRGGNSVTIIPQQRASSNGTSTSGSSGTSGTSNPAGSGNETTVIEIRTSFDAENGSNDTDNGTNLSDDITVLNLFGKKNDDSTEMDVTCEDPEAATTTLLDEVHPDSTSTSVTFMEKLKLSCPFACKCCMFCIQIYMIIRKRLWNSKRNKKAMFFEIVLPALFIAITLAFTLILPPATDEPPREITPWAYNSPNNIYFSEPNRTRRRGFPSEFRSFVDELIGPIGMGTACLSDQHNANICNHDRWSSTAVQEFNTSRMNFTGAKFDDCSCAIGTLQCPKSVNREHFPKLKTQTNDYILDVSNTNIAEWILKTYDKFIDSRYGGFELQLRRPSGANFAQYLSLLKNLTSLIPLPEIQQLEESRLDKLILDGLGTKPPSTKHIYKIWYENRGWLSSVGYLNALHNIWLRAKLPSEYIEQKADFGITLLTHPMNLTKSQNTKESLKTAGLGVIHAICIIFALSFIPASFTVYLIEERTCGGKHLHLVSGVRPITYWIANFIFDMGKYLVPTVLCLVLFKLFDAQAYIGAPSFWSFLCLLLLYGWASIPAMYPFSFLFGVPSTAFVVLACSNLFIGVVTTVSTFVLEQFGDEELEEVGEILKKVFLVFPHYCLGRCCIELVKLNVENTAINAFAMQTDYQVNRFKWEHLGEKLFYLGIHGLVYFSLNLLFEYRHVLMLICKLFPSKKRIPCEEDIDVVKERERIENSNGHNMTLSAVNLTKYYKGKIFPAVNGLTFGMGKGECFGLLGVNGAGKTSTFKMLTGDVRISSGNAKICGADVETSLDNARKHFGYCPQEDSIDPLLTGYELLLLYGRLRGLSSEATETAAKRLIKTLGLSRYALRRSGTYSGGNKRKLSTAIALIGDPDLIFLDEPTSGMDPGARRDLWKVILDLLHIGKTVVLTSHSMEECEVLCTKIAIMVNGQFMCLGSLQHLKNRFGKGYTVTIRCSENFQGELLQRISSDISAATLEDQHCSQLKFNIPQDVVELSGIFNTLNEYKSDQIIEDYSVSQTTLDDIFVRFAGQQKDALDR